MLSRGIHRYPAEAAAEIAWNAVLSHPFEGVAVFVPYADEDVRLFTEIRARLAASSVPTVWCAGESFRVNDAGAARLRVLGRPEEPFEPAAWLIGPEGIRRLAGEGLALARSYAL